jgi:hypothetical protein
MVMESYNSKDVEVMKYCNIVYIVSVLCCYHKWTV